ncbi:L-alanyl-D-glutamate peptidase [Fusobacterium necrophorum subsp. funduliforme]|uniref:hypothetical protein n=1 Tax=Fusobacterium necrophorum TaxID=859 RepID=UPI000787297B|nr:hypothetical protein [Fusobacterium necrophorum]KYM50707.1 lysozyme [Fusobacterium necrophorum subsp. funduliforme]
MPKFSKRSLDNLKDCHPDLKKIAELAIQRVDFTIIEGHRSKAKQLQNVKSGASQTMNSKHCEYPSRAFDFIPYPFKGWNDSEGFNNIGEVILQCAKELKIFARRGADWNMNGRTDDEKFYDGPHIELMSLKELEQARTKYGNYIK